jgi:hypothetical protein
MQKIQSRVAVLACLASLVSAPTAFAFETVDTLPWPSRGRFPAYTADPVRPTSFWAEAGVMYDDNLLRLQNDRKTDTVGRVGVGGHYEQRIVGRERLVVDARLAGYGFANFENLDHLAYSAQGLWVWEASNDLTGTLVGGRDQRLVDISERQNADRRELLTLTRVAGTAAYRLGPSSRVRGGADAGWGESSARPDLKLRATSANFGADYVSPLGNTLGVDFRTAQGDAPVPETVAPVGTFVNNDFREREAALVGTYFAPGRRLRLDARLGHTRRTYTELPNRDFSGTTYRGGGEWSMSAKTALDFFAYHEPRSILDVAASHVVVTGLALGPRWAYSEKTVFSLRWIRERRTFEGDATRVTAANPLRDELLNTARFGIGWEPERQWQVGLGLDGGTRASNFFGRSYHYWAAMANVAYRY